MLSHLPSSEHFSSVGIWLCHQKHKWRFLCWSFISIGHQGHSKHLYVQADTPSLHFPLLLLHMHSENSSKFTDRLWWWSLSSPLIDPALFLFPNSNQDRIINHSSTAPPKLHTPIFECYRLLLRKDWTRNLTVVLLQFGNTISESFVVLSKNNQ